MKRKLFPLLTLTLAGTLLLVGCAEQTNSQRPSNTSTAQSTEWLELIENPTPTYRPDLVWETYPDYFNEDQVWIPAHGDLYASFLLSNLEPGEEYGRLKHPDNEFAVYFLYYDWDDNYLTENGKIRYCNWDALVEYLSNLGIEEIGKEGGFSIPIFAATIAELEMLDCDILQDLMGVSDYTDHGLSVCISSVNEKTNQMDFRYAQMHSWNSNSE